MSSNTDGGDQASVMAVPGVALQMWTVREQMRADAGACVAEVGEAGYAAVELVGYGNAGYEAVRDHLGVAGVQAISQHVSHQRLAQDLDAVIAENVGLGCTYLVIQQGRHEDWLDADTVRSFAATCNEWGQQCRQAGLALGYHGYHELDFEFAPYGNGTRWDLFTDEIDPELVFLQLDTFWVAKTGADPAAMLHRFAGRVPTLHLKDTSPAEGAFDTSVGDGLLDLDGVLAAAKQVGTRWAIVEQEGDPANAYRDIRRSRNNALQALARTA